MCEKDYVDGSRFRLLTSSSVLQELAHGVPMCVSGGCLEGTYFGSSFLEVQHHDLAVPCR